MDDEDDYEAFLYIVHVSDLHCRSAGATTDLKTERRVQAFVALLRRFSRDKADFVEASWEQGLAGHDPDAHDKFCAFLEWFAKNPQFRGIKTWLLDTGDLASMGDLISLVTAKGWLKEYARILGAEASFMLYGNHDAWPGRFPMVSSFAELAYHRVEIRKTLFPASWPQGPLSASIPYSDSKLLMYGVGSAIDDHWYNTFALGNVDTDPCWVGEPGSDQLVALAHRTEQGFHPDGKTRDFRILAVHHPVHYPQRPKHSMNLMNDKAVANALIGFDAKGRGKLAHLVLSGHTHESHPKLGRLPGTAVGAVNQPLAAGQMQLIAGSLSQMPRDADRESASAATFVPHQCEILTFWASPTKTGKLRIERRLPGRPGGTGPYKFLTAQKPSVESVVIEY